MAELADAHGLGPCTGRCVGSTPTARIFPVDSGFKKIYNIGGLIIMVAGETNINMLERLNSRLIQSG